MATPYLFELTEGATKELPALTLKINGVVLDLTGYNASQIAVKLRTATGDVAPWTGTVRIDGTPSTGKVYLTPGATDFLATSGPYDLHLQVTDGQSKKAMFPSGKPAQIAVYPL